MDSSQTWVMYLSCRVNERIKFWGNDVKGHSAHYVCKNSSLLFWFVKLLHGGGIIFDRARSKVHLVTNHSLVQVTGSDWEITMLIYMYIYSEMMNHVEL